MKKSFILLLIGFNCLYFNCKNQDNKNTSGTSESGLEDQKDEMDLFEADQKAYLENAYFYVLAPNGLSLRKTEDLKGEKILTIPLGDKVKQTAVIYSADDVVENIAGSMMPVLYKAQEGYVFNGFLSKFPPLKEGEETEVYISRLKAIDDDVEFNTKETEPDFHEGIVETLLLPNIDWHEAFYLAKAQFYMPKSLNFPSPNGDKNETIEQADKKESVWSSELEVVRNSSQLDTIKYYYRAEAVGQVVEITRPNKKHMKIECTTFVD